MSDVAEAPARARVEGADHDDSVAIDDARPIPDTAVVASETQTSRCSAGPACMPFGAS